MPLTNNLILRGNYRISLIFLLTHPQDKAILTFNPICPRNIENTIFLRSGVTIVLVTASTMASQAQTSPIPGTAEHAALYLTGHGLGCPHHPKYSIIDTQNPKYPSRVGLFYNGRTDIAYLDTEMLCINCCDAIIPEGFNSWSLFAKLVKMNPGTKPPKRWLNLQSNTSAVKPEDSYPALVQCGAQALSAVASQSQSIIVPMPLQHPEARVAWQWLQDQRKPFYIDHLHLSKGWRPAAERNASLDSPIAEKNGIQFVAGQTAKPNKIPSPGKHTADAPAEKKTKGRTKQKEVTKANQGGVAAEAAISSLGSDVDKEEQQGVTCKKQDHVTVRILTQRRKKLH